MHDKGVDMRFMLFYILLFQKNVFEIRSQYLFAIVLGDKSKGVDDYEAVPDKGMNFSVC
jgi:hypothetical protein